jgi:RNA polymerase primary sigma factor
MSSDYYYSQIKDFDISTKEEELELIKLAHNNNDDIAREKLIKSNIRIAYLIAREFHTSYKKVIPLDDIVAEANLFLVKASLDVKEGYDNKFSTFAAVYIRNGLKAFCREFLNKIYFPQKLYKNMKQAFALWGKGFTIEEISSMIGVAEFKVREFFRYKKMLNVSSLDLPIDAEDGEDACLLDFLEDEIASKEIDARIDDADEKFFIKDILKKAPLSFREKSIMSDFFGLTNGEPQNLDDISKKHNLSRQRVHVLKDKGVMKIRKFVMDSPKLLSMTKYKINKQYYY